MFKSPTLNEMTVAVADALPEGKAWKLKNQKGKMNDLLRGFAVEFVRVAEDLQDIAVSYIPTEINLGQGTFFVDWLRAFKIPDECLFSFSEPQLVALYLIAKSRRLVALSDRASYDALATFFGATLKFSYPADHTIIITIEILTALAFPYTFPFVFGGASGSLLKCIFEKRVPMHIDLTVNIVEI